MKKIYSISLFLKVLFFLLIFQSSFSQNVGIGTTTPTHPLHVSPLTAGDPLRVDGMLPFSAETGVLVIDPTQGIVRYMPFSQLMSIDTIIYGNDTTYTIIRDSLLGDSVFLDSLIMLIGDSIDTDIDSMKFMNDTLYLYEDNQVLTAYINVSFDTALVDSLIIASSDTLYSIISDSLSGDTIWIHQLDSLLSIYGDTIYFNDTSYTLIRDSLLGDSVFLDSLISLIGDSIDTDIDSMIFINDTLYLYEDNQVLTAYINPSLDTALVDSLIIASSDTLYSIFSDSLLGDTIWIHQLDSLLGIYGDTIYFNDTSYTLIRDSLLGDSVFLDSLISLIGDSIDTDIDSMIFINDTLYLYEDNQVLTAYINPSLDTALVDSLIIASSDTLYSIISDSLLGDTIWIHQLDSLLGIYGDTIYFNDTSYTLIRDSLLGDSVFLDSLISLIGDSIDTDIDSMIFINDTLYLYEDNQVLTAYINPSLDTALVDSLIIASSDTLYSIISDSLLGDTIWIHQLDSLLGIYGDTIYFNDTSYTLIRDSLLGDSVFLDSLISLIGDSINTDDQNIDSLTLTGTILTTYIENGASANVDLQPIIDSAIANSISADNDWDINGNGTGLEGNPGTNTASGGNSIAAGDGSIASGSYAVAFGQSGTANGTHSVVGGGFNNRSSSNYTVVSGGRLNIASGIESFVGGGDSDTASGENSVVAGGIQNKAEGWRSVVGGGENNKALTQLGVIVGGRDNIVTGGGLGAILGGEDNYVSAQHASVGGGYRDTAAGFYSVVSGGRLNAAKSFGSVVSGGNNNKSTASYATISGGTLNLASGTESYVGGGDRDTASGNNAYVGGGELNKATGVYTVVSGGASNIASNMYSTVSGGQVNTASGRHTVVSGGVGNTASGGVSVVSGGGGNNAIGIYSFIGGGLSNEALGDYSVVSGGQNDTATGSNSIVVGGFNNKANALSSIVVGGNDNLAAGNFSFIGGGYGDTVTGVASVVSGGDRNKALYDYVTVSGGSFNTAIGDFSTISGGTQNSTNAGSGTIGGGIDNTVSGLTGTIAGGSANLSQGSYSAVGGGRENASRGDYSTIAGGYQDTINSGVVWSFIGGGYRNKVTYFGSVIGGGYFNTASGRASVISGGHNNTTTGWESAVAGGAYCVANSYAELAFGHNNTTYTANSVNGINSDDRVLNIGNGLSPVSRSDALVLHKDGNLFIGSDFPNPTGMTGTRMTSGAKVLFFNRGTAPGTLVGTNKTAIWNNAGEIQVKDESDNITTISPHNFTLIPDGASEELAWSFYSERNGKAINVDMAKMARLVEEMSGENLVYLKNNETQEVETKELDEDVSVKGLIIKNKELEEEVQALKKEIEEIKALLLNKE